MCRVTGPYEGDEFIGYKVVVKKEGRYYSWYTGQEYNGPVGYVNINDLCTSAERIIANHWSDRHNGKTAAFVSLQDAVEYCLPDNTIVKVKLTDNLHHGLYCGNFVILGENIEVLTEDFSDELDGVFTQILNSWDSSSPLRKGQQLFNTMYTLCVEAANKLRNSLVDPYYDDNLIPACIERYKELYQQYYADQNHTSEK